MNRPDGVGAAGGTFQKSSDHKFGSTGDEFLELFRVGGLGKLVQVGLAQNVLRIQDPVHVARRLEERLSPPFPRVSAARCRRDSLRRYRDPFPAHPFAASS